MDLWGNPVQLKTLLAIVLGVKERWGNVRVFSPAGTLETLMGSLGKTSETLTSRPETVEGLESLILSSVPKSESFWQDHGLEYTLSLSAYPNLKYFGFSWPGTFCFSIPDLPITLQRLDLNYYMPVEELRQIVSCLPNLVALRVYFDRNAWREEREEWAWKGEKWSVNMQKLEVLDLRTPPGGSVEHFLKFIDRLTLPALKDFTMEYTSFPTPPLESIHKMFERSFPGISSGPGFSPLKRLTLLSYDRSGPDAKLLQIFEFAPSLEYLRIQNTDLSDTSLQILELFHEDDNDSENEELVPVGLFPNLQHL